MDMSQVFIINNPDEARQALCKVACAYMDFYEYWSKISELEERFDESVEQYDPVTWLSGLSVYNGNDEDGPTSTIDEATSLLRETADGFYSLVSNARTGCENVLRQIFQLPIDVAALVLGFTISQPAEKMGEFLSFFFRYLEDNGMYFDENELYTDESIKVVDIFQSMDVKFQRFLQVLEQVKDMEIPQDSVSDRTIDIDALRLIDSANNITDAMERFIKMRETQTRGICLSCKSDFYADNEDIESGMVACPHCGAENITYLGEQEEPTREELEAEYEDLAARYIKGNKMKCFCPKCNKDYLIPLDQAEQNKGICPICKTKVIRYI